jgi:hypothetical protein
MIDITLEGGYVTFNTSVLEVIDSPVELCEVVDDNTYHLGTILGIFLINIEEFTVNSIKFNSSADAVNYILNN